MITDYARYLASASACLRRFHLTNLGVGPHDLNSIFYYKGMWHVMHQANWTDWAHLVSVDLARWTRLPSVRRGVLAAC